MQKPISEAEFQELVWTHQQPLKQFISVICPNQFAREDILQETNRVLWEKRDDFRPGSNFLAWARRIAQFQTLSFSKSLKSKSWLYFDSNLVQSLATRAEQRDELQQRRSKLLSVCLSKVSDRDKNLIVLKYEKQMSLKEISQLTGRPEGGLKQAFLRIRRTLRECVDRGMMAE